MIETINNLTILDETDINKESTFIESLILSIEELNLTDELEDSIEILNSHRDMDDYLRIENIERLDKEIKKIEKYLGKNKKIIIKWKIL